MAKKPKFQAKVKAARLKDEGFECAGCGTYFDTQDENTPKKGLPVLTITLADQVVSFCDSCLDALDKKVGGEADKMRSWRV